MSTFAVALLAASGAGAARAQNALPQSTLRGETELADGFTEITHVRELSDGRVLVLDQRESRIALADFMAGTVVQVGRDGDGPGEYRSPVLIVPLRGDTTLAWDFIGARTSLFAPSANGTGRIAGTTTWLRNVRGPPRFLPRDADSAGFLYGVTDPIIVRRDGSAVVTNSFSVERLDRSTGRRDTLFLLPASPGRRTITSGQTALKPALRPFRTWIEWAVAPDGRVAVIWPEPYQVAIFEGGRWRGPVRVEESPEPLTSAVKREWLEEYHQRVDVGLRAAASAGLPADILNEMMMAEADELEWPSSVPPFVQRRGGSLHVAPNGELWVLRTPRTGRPTWYDVFDRDGRRIRRVELPNSVRIVGFGRSSVYLQRTDADGVQHLQRAPIR